MGTIVPIQGARLSYPHLFQARSIQAGDEPKFSAAFLIPKNNPAIPAIQAAIEVEKGTKWGASVPPSVGSTLYDGDTNPKYNTDPNNHGHYVLNTSSKADRKPKVVDQNVANIIDTSRIYAGCYVNAEVDFYPYDMGVSKGIACGLLAVQLVAEGERLDGHPEAGTSFAPIAGAPPPLAPTVGGAPVPGPQPYAQPAAPVYPPTGIPPQAAPVAPAPVAAPAAPGTVPPPPFL